jgi:hypothetical protein
MQLTICFCALSLPGSPLTNLRNSEDSARYERLETILTIGGFAEDVAKPRISLSKPISFNVSAFLFIF